MGIISQPPEWWRKCFKLFCGEAVFRLLPEDESPKSVYLTFDDGPIPEVTPFILECLHRYNIKATFFMVGDNASKHPALVKDILAAGHSVGNHSMHHLQGCKTRNADYFKDIASAARHIPSRLFRPPHGLLKRSQLKVLSRFYSIIMFDVVTRDYAKGISAEKVVNNVKRLTRNGSIIVFHDSLKSKHLLPEALPASIEWLLNEGYSFLTLPPEGL